ncbi:folate receptor gamma [Hyalella azteca]|uniref:Folate receptor gamma n=1 Tax=Hyalella azteca TaxID=294128 RepID=A0A979FXU3_HYAAZ|nr:folate receptor gamma [Hyalella azteca]
MFIYSRQHNSRVQLNHCKILLNNGFVKERHSFSVSYPHFFPYEQCSPWRNRSCCTQETARAIHESSHHPLDYDHCKSRRTLSKDCRRHFTQDDCFYECSPNVGPWVVKDNERPWRTERFYGVPLCASDCEAWFEACLYDFTCTDNWSLNFRWVTITDDGITKLSDGRQCKNGASSCKVNVCPEGSSCVTFLQMYGNASNFCETVWDGSWRYTPDDQPCMRLWFDGEAGNPNVAVAEFYANLKSASGVDTLLLSPALALLVSVVAMFIRPGL